MNNRNLSLSDFELKRRLGDGSYSDVVLVQQTVDQATALTTEEEDTRSHDDEETQQQGQEQQETNASSNYYALKIVDKHHILKHRAVGQVQLERRLLELMNDEDCTVRLYFTFQDSANLYLGLEPCLYGELYDAIDRLEMEDVVFYAAEIVVMLEVLRRYKVVHRDLKPENLLLGYGGHLKLIDFGSAYCLATAEDLSDGEGDDTNTSDPLMGTAEYLAVEVLEHTNGAVTHGVDLWSFGCIIYHMCLGKTPFRGASEFLTFNNILEGDVDYSGFDGLSSLGKEAKDLVERLLRRNPSSRIGFSSLDEIRSHAFFDSIDDWNTLYEREETPYFTRVLYPNSTGHDDDDDDHDDDWELRSLMAHAARLSS
jgi:3-phosphoinositide dependent protein kinase-1